MPRASRFARGPRLRLWCRLLLARALKFPEYYWAPISTIIIMQSSIQPFQGAWQRFVGTALGAALGAAIASYVGRTAVIYADRNFRLRQFLRHFLAYGALIALPPSPSALWC